MSEDPNRDTRPADPFATPRPEPSDTPWSQRPSGDGGSSASPGYGPPSSYPDPYSSDPYSASASPSYGASSYGAPSYGAPPYGASSYGGPSYGAAYPPYPGAQPGPYPPYPQSQSTNGMAIASLVLGIVQFVLFWFSIVGAILALVFGYVAKRQIEERGQQGRGMAIAGIVLGWIGVALVVLVVLIIALFAAADR